MYQQEVVCEMDSRCGLDAEGCAHYVAPSTHVPSRGRGDEVVQGGWLHPVAADFRGRGVRGESCHPMTSPFAPVWPSYSRCARWSPCYFWRCRHLGSTPPPITPDA